MDKNPRLDEIRRITISLPEALLLDVEETNLSLRKGGVRVSFSSLVEVSLKELMALPDIAGTLRHHGANARRTTNNHRADKDGQT